jgi:membrane protease subunit (stomatin/prohibitin family)
VLVQFAEALLIQARSSAATHPSKLVTVEVGRYHLLCMLLVSQKQQQQQQQQWQQQASATTAHVLCCCADV